MDSHGAIVGILGASDPLRQELHLGLQDAQLRIFAGEAGQRVGVGDAAVARPAQRDGGAVVGLLPDAPRPRVVGVRGARQAAGAAGAGADVGEV